MNISELSKKTGVSPRMLRYFEQQALLEPARNDNKYRAYNSEHQEQVLKVCEWQRLGLTLKEIKTLVDNPEHAEPVIEQVFQRERELYLMKQKSLQDLRERLTGKKHPYYENRVAHSVPQMVNVVDELESMGFQNTSFDYFRFSELQEHIDIEFSMIGEMIYQSAFYLLLGQRKDDKEELETLMANFCKAANKCWGIFDGNPPQLIEKEDVGIFFAPSDIIMHLQLSRDSIQSSLILPYQTIFAMAKSAEKKSDSLSKSS